ncbi:MAG: cation:proton antiporter [Bacteroidales bacterium]|nr:cation:proton antiporter [Bacteroidales bacterium]
MLHDLGIIMLVAGVISLICKWLKQPVVLGYIVAGLLAGPYVCGSSWVNVESAETWGQVGVIFLLFSLGLEFSFKKLLKMGSTAFIGCLTIVVGMMGSGFMLGRMMGWSEMNSMFLGGMLCMSSTTIVFKALDDLGLRQHKFAEICFGILVVEDLFAVVLMVLLASIAVNQQFDGVEMATEVGKLLAYLILWFVAGITLIPSLLRKCREHLNDETMTIVALGLCLGMVLVAKMAGFSEALGAFVMGSILSETVECERIEKLMAPIKNLFGAIFFVSVGMMIAPATLAEYWLPIVLITLTVIFGQIIFATLGITLSGQPMKTAMQSAFALTQVGEFAFIIAQFGESIGVTEKFLYPVVVAVSVITTFLTPYTIKLAQPAYGLLERVLPQKFFTAIGKLSQGKSTIAQQGIMRQLLKKVGLAVVVYGIVSAFIIILYQKFVSNWIVDAVATVVPERFEWVSRLVALVALLVALSPFIYKMISSYNNSPEAQKLRQDSTYRRISLVALFVARIILGMVFVTFCIGQYFNLTLGLLVAAAVVIMILIMVSSRVHKRSSDIEKRFIDNLSAREREQELNRSVRREVESAFLDYDLHLADFDLNPQSLYCGHQLLNLDLRRSCGVNIVRIVRGGVNINAPGGRERLYPHDRIVVAGSDEQIKRFSHDLDTKVVSDKDKHSGTRASTFSLEQLPVLAEMPFCGKTLADSRIGERAQCVVLGIEHEGNTTMNPSADVVLNEGDTLILAGETEKIKGLLG